MTIFCSVAINDLFAPLYGLKRVQALAGVDNLDFLCKRLHYCDMDRDKFNANHYTPGYCALLAALFVVALLVFGIV